MEHQKENETLKSFAAELSPAVNRAQLGKKSRA